MADFFVEIKEENPKRRAVNGLLSLITGIVILSWPEMLYIIIAAYLIANGITYLFNRSATIIGVGSILTGVFIYHYPDFIPIAFAVFLLILAFGTILSVGLSFMGIVAFIFALIILGTPAFVSYVIAAFLVFYGLMGLAAWWKMREIR